MGGFNTIIPEVTPTEIEIPLNKVKLPTPLESDYVTPANVLVSSYTKEGVSAEQKIRNPRTIRNENNIYDNDDSTYGDVYTHAWEGKIEVVVWDLGSVKTRVLRVKHWGTPQCYSRICVSGDDSTYTTVSESTGTIIEETYTGDFRYVKYEIENVGSVSGYLPRLYTLNVNEKTPLNSIDDDLVTYWESVSESNPYLTVDVGALKICSGIRVYWGSTGRPSNYKISVSEDNVVWEDVLTFDEAPPADTWTEYIFNARYVRYIRIQALETLAMRIYEVDYYSRIVERVASEHGHGSGVTPHLHVEHSSSHPKMMIAETLRNERIRKYGDFIRRRRMTDLIEYVKALEKELDALWKIVG